MNKILTAIIVLLIFAGGMVFWQSGEKEIPVVTNFEECAALGNPIMESYPRQCRFGNQTFTENIGNELDKTNLIRLNAPRPNQVIKSPLVIEGEARGNWFFEGSFPVVLTDWDGLIIAQGIATAKGEWMTTEFVPFTAKLEFKNPTYKNNGSLILKKDNPSGLPQNDDALEIPVIFEKIDNPAGILPYNSGVSGTVLLGPTCPVMRDPPDPQCADRPYATEIVVRHAGVSSVFLTGSSDANGLFKFALPPGSYSIIAGSGKMLPRCNKTNVTVLPGSYATTTISCDTGIR